MSIYADKIRKAETQGQIYTILAAAAYDASICTDDFDTLQAMADCFADLLTVKGVSEWTA